MPQKGIENDINIAMLRAIQADSRKTAAEIIKPHIGTLSEVALRRRLDILERDGYIKSDRTTVPGRVYFRLLKNGEALAGI